MKKQAQNIPINAAFKSWALLFVFLFAVLVKETHHIWAHHEQEETHQTSHFSESKTVFYGENDTHTEGSCALCDWSFSTLDCLNLPFFGFAIEKIGDFKEPIAYQSSIRASFQNLIASRGPPTI